MDGLTYACEGQNTGKLTVAALVVYFIMALFRLNGLTCSTAEGI